jgi:hypothetical protein
MKNYQAILMIILSYGVAYGIITGYVQNYVYFAGELNELFCFVMAFMMGTMGLFAIDYKKLIKALF